MTEESILERLHGEPFDGLSHALDGAVSHPTHRVIAALPRLPGGLRDPGREGRILEGLIGTRSARTV